MSSASVMHCPQDHHPSLVHVHLCPPDGNLESRGTPLQENEQQAITDILRMLGDEEPPQGATSKAAPPRPAAQQPPQPTLTSEGALT